jgi:alkanesulfonate monooxygenase SsuD/methylene tetrahydromethanopterin reductase-like flavin-dependent oxidoreductase (luciferase family)
MPALEKGFAKAGRTRDDFEISGPGFIVTGTTEEEMSAATEGVKGQIAFYGSTPAYRGVLEQHGWGDLQTELNGLSKEGRWKEMGQLIDDDMLGEFAIIGAPEEIASKWTARWGGQVDRLSFYAPYKSDPERWAQVLQDLKSA